MNWVLSNLPLIGDRTLAHIGLSLPAIVFTFILSIPLGWLANRLRGGRGVFVGVLGILYAIPSLALFPITALIIGVNLRADENVVFVLTIYGVAVMARSAADGLASIDPDIIQSATAMGYGRWRRFWAVELPLSGPVLLAGMRVVSVSTVSLVTVSGALGSVNLGLLFLDGFQRNIPAEIIAGTVGTIIIALVFDALIVLLGRILMPWQRALSAPSRRVARRIANRSSEVAA
ncbi:ABC transporter permease subunit [Microbacteriaceae bacterium VKM Ac-2855]|nr:ABC transporter permease subunit [Microbacteriaceae bacterium VKM Ac-2855]